MKQWLRTPSWIEPVRFFVVVALFFGLLFLLITPPFQGADEIVHFYRTYQISEGHLRESNGPGGAGGVLPVSLGKIVDITTSPPISFHPDAKYAPGLTRNALELSNNQPHQKFYQFAASAIYSPVSYILPSSGMAIVRLLHLPNMVALYAGRLGNLLTWVALMALAIYFMPRRKWAVVAIGLLPMALFQAATLNGDPVTIGSLFLFLALILHFRESRRPLSNKHIAALLLMAIVMTLSKEIMFVFLPLLFLLKDQNFASKRTAYMVRITLFLVPIVVLLGWVLAQNGLNTTATYVNQQNPTAQLKFILKAPYSFVNVIWNTYFYTWGDSITRSFIGTFGWADGPLSELVVTLGYIGLATTFIASTGSTTKAWLSKNEKILLWVLALIYWLAVSASLYLYYSPVGFKIVYGLQGRYFIPMAALAVPLLVSKRIKIDGDLYKKIVVYMPLFLLIASTITLFVRYFVHNV